VEAQSGAYNCSVQTVAGIALTGTGMGVTSIGGLFATASVLNGADDLCANFTKDNKTVIEKGLGTQGGRVLKASLSGFGVVGSATTLYKESLNANTIKDAVGGSLDMKSTIDNVQKATSNGN